MTVAKATEKPSIDGALAKLGRGREHLEILEEAVRAYVEDSDSFGHEAIPLPQGGGYTHRARRLVEPPVQLALICGDAIHNMRASLDYLVRQLGILDKGMVSDKSAFPIVADAGEEEVTWKSVAGRSLALLSDTHVAEIRALQPFVNGTDNSPQVMLQVLEWLENVDKHRLPLVVTAAAIGANLRASGQLRKIKITPLSAGPTIVDEKGVDLYELRGWGPASEVKVDSLTSMAVMFGAADGPNVLALRRLADMVGGIIGSFALDISGGSVGADT